MDLKTAEKVAKLYEKISCYDYRWEELREYGESELKRFTICLNEVPNDAKKLALEMTIADMERQLEEAKKELNSIKIDNEYGDDRNKKMIEFAEILQRYCKEIDCVECAFAKSNGDCSICKLPDCWDIPNEQV